MACLPYAAACASADDTSDEASDALRTTCAARPTCDGSPPRLEADGFDRWSSYPVIAMGGPQHRVRDAVMRADQTQWLHGKFAYGLNDKDLKDERVEVFVRRGSAEGGSAWARPELRTMVIMRPSAASRTRAGASTFPSRKPGSSASVVTKCG
jgi:hypothetical protein